MSYSEGNMAEHKEGIAPPDLRLANYAGELLSELLKVTPNPTDEQARIANQIATSWAKGKIEDEDEIKRQEEENERLRGLVHVDTLVTSVLNHGRFLEVLEEEVVKTKQMPNPSSVLVVIDLDDFKKTNEFLGHPGADQLLIDVGKVITESIRPGDSPGRTGGDEFSIILRRTDLEYAIGVAERIRQSVSTTIQQNHPRQGFSQKVSMGLCLIQPGLATHEIRSIADAALYTVKNNGRNQVAVGIMNSETHSIETYVIPPK